MMLFRSLFIVLALASSPGIASEQISPIESGYNRLLAIDTGPRSLSERERNEATLREFEATFRQRLNEDALRATSAEDLDWLLKAAHVSIFYGREMRHLRDLGRILSELESRGVATNTQRILMYRSLIGYRRFDEARIYLSLHPGLEVEPVPEVGGARGLSANGIPVYEIDPGQTRLLPLFLDVQDGTHLVIVSHPLCAFSRAAMQFVNDNPKIAEALDERAIWLTPVDMRLHFEEIQQWNRNHPETQIMIARYRHDWPMVEEWDTPQFYLLRDGTVIGHFSGWPLDGSRQQSLLDLVGKIGSTSAPE